MTHGVAVKLPPDHQQQQQPVTSSFVIILKNPERERKQMFNARLRTYL